MEIGVDNGDNAKNMIEVSKELFPSTEVEYYGFDTVDYESQIRKVKENLSETGCKFKLFEGDTVNTLPKHIGELPLMDLIFIDGGKSYNTVKSDWEHSSLLMHDKTGVFFHNYSFSGVNQVVNNISEDKYKVKIIKPSDDYETALIQKI